MTDFYDTTRVTPDDLVAMPDAEFRKVVDADLRRRRNPDGLPEEVSRALRSPVHVRRWANVLEGIVRFSESQVRTLDSDFAARLAALEEQREEASGGGRSSLMREISDLRTEHNRRRNGTIRFSAVVSDHLSQAKALIDSAGDSSAASERDGYARRVLVLENAIREHRRAVQDDLDEGERAEHYEHVLWSVLDT